MEQPSTVKVTVPELSDIEDMAQLEASWNLRNLPADAMSKTGALYRILGAERLQELSKDPRAILLVLKSSGVVQGIVIAYRDSLALEIYPGMPADYAPQHPLWRVPFVYVKTIAVHPDLIGTGLGKRLLEALRQRAESANCRHIIAGIALAPQKNERSVGLFSGCLKATEVGRHVDPGSGITWGLFCSR